MTTRRQTKLVHEREYVAEVDVELIDSDAAWAPYLSIAQGPRSPFSKTERALDSTSSWLSSNRRNENAPFRLLSG